MMYDNNWENVFNNSKDIQVKTFNTGSIHGKIDGIINTKEKVFPERYRGKKVILPVLAHVINYKNNYYLIDTGFDSSFSKIVGGSFKGIFKPIYFKNRYIQETEIMGIENQLKTSQITINSIFLTHAHEYCAGLHTFDENIPLYVGKGEKDINIFPFAYSNQLKKHKHIVELDFDENGLNMPILGKCIDIFNDNSFWAINTRGHTKGHVSYLINSKKPVLIMGDLSISSLCFDLGIESGTFNEDGPTAKRSFKKMSKFLNRFPFVKTILGHEKKEEYKIKYI